MFSIFLLATEALIGASFGEGTGRVWLTNVQCTGSERALINCIANSSGINSCTHAQDAGVQCQSGIMKLHSTTRCSITLLFH